ncbi:hypothetical protein BJ912DRAFT_1094915 [Pholiota molesta]|nr:hypothetical protein BJ912DRAFT_1094915 [Pholiota molesta]
MLTTKNWSNEIFKNCANIDGCVAIPFNTGKWLFVGCIIFSFLLLAYESRKAKKIIASRDISYAFTNIMANNTIPSVRSYDHFCFFDHISNSTKTSDDFAFFVFFVFKSWKRLLLADAPRQTINALTLYAGNSLSTSALTVSSLFTVLVCAGSLLLLLVAGLCYIPLLLHIRGNLKEYCCHKVDKVTIGVIIKRKQKERRAEAARLAQKEAEGDFSHLKNKKGDFIAQPLPQPTLPNLSIDDDDDTSSMNTRADYPPMPPYNPYAAQQGPGTYAHYNPSAATLGYDDPNTPLPTPWQPVYGAVCARSRERQGSPYTAYDPRDVYQGRSPSVAPHQQQQQHIRRAVAAAAVRPGAGRVRRRRPVRRGYRRKASAGRDPYAGGYARGGRGTTRRSRDMGGVREASSSSGRCS